MGSRARERGAECAFFVSVSGVCRKTFSWLLERRGVVEGTRYGRCEGMTGGSDIGVGEIIAMV